MFPDSEIVIPFAFPVAQWHNRQHSLITVAGPYRIYTCFHLGFFCEKNIKPLLNCTNRLSQSVYNVNVKLLILCIRIIIFTVSWTDYLSQQVFSSCSVMARITLQGLPTATELSGISLTTTLPPPITTLLPIVTPGMT